MDEPFKPLSEQDVQVVRNTFERVAGDRRRLGRLKYANPALIPLLRGEVELTPTSEVVDLCPDGNTLWSDRPNNSAVGISLLPEDEADPPLDQERLSPAARAAAIFIISVLLWAAIGFGGWITVS